MPGSRADLLRENKELRSALTAKDCTIDELTTQLRRSRTCYRCGTLLTADERACDDCHRRPIV